MSASTYRRYLSIGKVTVIHQRKLDFVKEINEVFPSSHFLGVTALGEVVLIGCDEEATLCLIRAATAFNSLKSAVLDACPFYHFAPPFFIQIRNDYERHER